ncbi:nickel/cobalt efflux system [Kaistia sp. 32K]|uniref:nickel/cobalt transporter n=1 Tax=Kaistia sp. 32K TaxID=2795690 RepID=UPI0019156E4A|nr:nickel/cobalt transporter [Kaistia sp. 32K]BCP55055.1 nickel/cobalt efflux system [Kaistia sp. 32K]
MRRLASLWAGALVALAPVVALAAPSPFGIATPDGSGSTAWAGPFAPIFVWIARQQSVFYRDLTSALMQLTQSGHAATVLIGLSFLYGIFHAVGPGHGKAVISSYLLATGDRLKRGVVISFASALAQAVTAILVVSIGTLVLNVTAVTMTRATDALEIASYALITLCGAWLLWTKLTGRGHSHAGHDHAGHDHAGHSHAGHDHAGHSHAAHSHAHHDHPHHDHSHHDHDHGHDHAHNHEHGLTCDCGHSHAPDPATLDKPLTLARAWTAILAVGVRPCSGAVIVLVFAVSQKLYWAGILSVLMMALGTGITVSALAIFAVKAKDIALRFSGGESRAQVRIVNGLQIVAASGILIFGLLMLGGAMAMA